MCPLKRRTTSDQGVGEAEVTSRIRHKSLWRQCWFYGGDVLPGPEPPPSSFISKWQVIFCQRLLPSSSQVFEILSFQGLFTQLPSLASIKKQFDLNRRQLDCFITKIKSDFSHSVFSNITISIIKYLYFYL